MSTHRILKLLLGVALPLAFATRSFAAMVVFDPTNYAENVVTAAKAVQGEIYQNTNIIYQYSMMENQLLQATLLPGQAMQAAFSQITTDITRAQNYGSTLSSLYGGLNAGAAWLSNVQSLITQSGKTPDQWFTDEATLRAANDKAATAMFQQGNDVLTHVNQLSSRRQALQTQLSATQTQQATAALTTHYLDVVAAQNNDMLQMMASAQQRAAQKASIENAQSSTNATAMQTIIDSQSTQRSSLDSAFPTSTAGE